MARWAARTPAPSVSKLRISRLLSQQRHSWVICWLLRAVPRAATALVMPVACRAITSK